MVSNFAFCAQLLVLENFLELTDIKLTLTEFLLFLHVTNIELLML